MTNYKIHELAEIFPPLSDHEFQELVADIQKNGQREPIILFNNQVLDGVNRHRACQQVGIETRVRNYTGTDPLSVVISENLRRRHLNESQRAVIAAKILEMNGYAHGGSRKPPEPAPAPDKPQETPRAVADVAKDLNVSESSVHRARQVVREAPPEAVQAIESGEKTVHAVAQELKAPKPAKEIIVDKFDRVVPDEMVEEWKRAEQIGKKLQSLAREIKSIVSEGFSGPNQERLKDPIYAEITNSTISDAQALSWALSAIVPFAICPTCQGYARKDCGLCRKRGWISKFLYNSPAVSPETKAIIEGK